MPLKCTYILSWLVCGCDNCSLSYGFWHAYWKLVLSRVLRTKGVGFWCRKPRLEASSRCMISTSCTTGFQDNQSSTYIYIEYFTLPQLSIVSPGAILNYGHAHQLRTSDDIRKIARYQYGMAPLLVSLHGTAAHNLLSLDTSCYQELEYWSFRTFGGFRVTVKEQLKQAILFSRGHFLMILVSSFLLLL